MRAVFESLCVADVVTKSVGTSNPYNMIRATFEALGEQTSPKSVAQRRGKKVSDLFKRCGASDRAAEAEAAAVTAQDDGRQADQNPPELYADTSAPTPPRHPDRPPT